MGGGGDHAHHGEDFRGKVWSFTGGPYCRPKHWKRNTAIAMFGIFLVCIPIAMKSAELEAYIKQIICKRLTKFTGLCRALFVLCIFPGSFPRLEGLMQQRPHHPVRPIPSQLWCDNFGKKDY